LHEPLHLLAESHDQRHTAYAYLTTIHKNENFEAAQFSDRWKITALSETNKGMSSTPRCFSAHDRSFRRTNPFRPPCFLTRVLAWLPPLVEANRWLPQWTRLALLKIGYVLIYVLGYFGQCAGSMPF